MNHLNHIIKKVIENNLNFDFSRFSENPIRHLKEVSKKIHNVSGLYLVFCSESLSNKYSHLVFEVKNVNLTLLYFGKAGGVTKTGKIIKQGLNGRINNVVSNDIKRGVYWNKVMEINNINTFYVHCLLEENPTIIENKIYDYLNKNNFTYPIMNKKRGKKTKTKATINFINLFL